MPLDDGADTGCDNHIENHRTRKRADFLQVSHTRELGTSLATPS